MKKFILHIIVIALIAVYCLAVNLAGSTLSLQNKQAATNSWQDSSIFPLPSGLLCYAPENEVSLNFLNENYPIALKKQYPEAWETSKIENLLGQVWFSQYISRSREFLAKHNKTDIIFPFHNFW